MLTTDIGYIQLTEFNSSSDKDMGKALEGLQKAGMKALVLDLRNNPGGLLDVAVDVCKEFVGDGKLIVYTQGLHFAGKSGLREYCDGYTCQPRISLGFRDSRRSDAGPQKGSYNRNDHFR